VYLTFNNPHPSAKPLVGCLLVSFIGSSIVTPSQYANGFDTKQVGRDLFLFRGPPEQARSAAEFIEATLEATLSYLALGHISVEQFPYIHRPHGPSRDTRCLRIEDVN
jgi:hypothetical protein